MTLETYAGGPDDLPTCPIDGWRTQTIETDKDDVNITIELCPHCGKKFRYIAEEE